MKRTILTILAACASAALVLVGVTAASATPAISQGDVTIRHVTAGCHDWSVNGGAFRTAQVLVLREGQSFTVTNRDNCGHALVQVSGPSEALAGATPVEALGAPVRVPLHLPGVYTFTTQERSDLTYGSGSSEHFGFGRLASRGPDNTLVLTVRVLPSRVPTD